MSVPFWGAGHLNYSGGDFFGKHPIRDVGSNRRPKRCTAGVILGARCSLRDVLAKQFALPTLNRLSANQVTDPSNVKCCDWTPDIERTGEGIEERAGHRR